SASRSREPARRSTAWCRCWRSEAPAAWTIPTCRTRKRKRARRRTSRGSPGCRRTRTRCRAGACPARREPRLQVAEVAQFRRLRREVGGEVGDLLVGQVAGLRGHQRVAAGAGAVHLQRVRQVVAVLAAQLRIRRIDRLVAGFAVAVDAGLAGGLALALRKLLAGGDVAFGEAGGGARPRGRVVAFAAAAGGKHGGGSEQDEGEGVAEGLVRHG